MLFLKTLYLKFISEKNVSLIEIGRVNQIIIFAQMFSDFCFTKVSLHEVN